MALIKGAMLIALPVLALRAPRMGSGRLRVASIGFLLYGGYLLYAGLSAA
jgi:hypothetical protein